jgi:glycolate oxidase iron-sulfur subunit
MSESRATDVAARAIAGSAIDYAATLDCVHCGLCLPSCPTYRETGRESSSPRGRIHLMRAVAEGRLAIDAAFAEEMYLCLACRACESVCPAGVRYGHLVETARAEVDARGARPRLRVAFERWLLRHVVAAPRALRAVAAGLRLYQRTGLARAVRASGLLGLWPALRAAERALPAVPPAYRAAGLVPAEGERRGRVGFLAGCIAPELLGPANRATVRVLARNGFDVVIPSEQVCCGALHLHSGDVTAAAALREQNLRAFVDAGVDAVVTSSAGCGAALRDVPDALGRATVDVSELLVHAGVRPPGAVPPVRVAYTDPCHLRHAQRVVEAPRALLRAIPGIALLDLPGADECCGAAGIYSLTHREMSDRLLAQKVAAIRAVAPDVVATGNPGCILQLARGVRDAGLRVDVVHPVELLERAYFIGDAGRA